MIDIFCNHCFNLTGILETFFLPPNSIKIYAGWKRVLFWQTHTWDWDSRKNWFRVERYLYQTWTLWFLRRKLRDGYILQWFLFSGNILTFYFYTTLHTCIIFYVDMEKKTEPMACTEGMDASVIFFFGRPTKNLFSNNNYLLYFGIIILYILLGTQSKVQWNKAVLLCYVL